MIKDQSFLEDKASYCIDFAKKNGATDVQVSVGNSISETVNFRNKKLDESERSDTLLINLTTLINKKKSTISSSNLEKNNLNILINRCIETTKNSPDDEYNCLPDQELLAKNINDLNLYDKSHISNEKKINFLSEVDENVFINDKIENSESSFSENKSIFTLANSKGFLGGYKSSSFSASCVAVAKSNGSMERDYEFTNQRFLEDIAKADKIGKVASDNAIKKLNSKKISSEKIPIIFDKRISRGILNILSSAISGSSIARNTSFLKGAINKEIFNKKIDVIDKPDILKGLASRPFDSEGVISSEIKIVENGILNTYLTDTYYGKKLNLKSNGRAGGTTNLFFQNGSSSFDDLIKSYPKLLYVTETIGHGSNLVTGDYSVGASGFIIENGEFVYPVSEITIAGNFKDIFKNLTLANDLEYKYATNAPTTLVEGMTVAGK
jgi:PmbA protein|tara:strand:+ start:3490 stop:4806 length:1317 start_codon:yes stop_codon:yes gene_type:complete